MESGGRCYAVDLLACRITLFEIDDFFANFPEFPVEGEPPCSPEKCGIFWFPEGNCFDASELRLSSLPLEKGGSIWLVAEVRLPFLTTKLAIHDPSRMLQPKINVEG